jgi:hypothetical protein
MYPKPYLDDAGHLLTVGAAAVCFALAAVVATLDGTSVSARPATHAAFANELAAGALVYRMPPLEIIVERKA